MAEKYRKLQYTLLLLFLAQCILSSGHVRTTRNVVRAAFLASHQPWAFQRGQKMFSLYILPRIGKGKTWTSLPCVELVNSLWTPGLAKRSFRLDQNGFTVWGPITKMTSFLDSKKKIEFGFNKRHVSSQTQNNCCLDRWANANTWFKNMHKNIREPTS